MPLYSVLRRGTQEQMERSERRAHVRNLRRRRRRFVHLALRQLEQVLHTVRRRVATDVGGEPIGVDVAQANLVVRPCAEACRARQDHVLR